MILTLVGPCDFDQLGPGLCQLRTTFASGLYWGLFVKPLREYACTLSLKLPQFCCLGSHSFRSYSLWSPYFAANKNYFVWPSPLEVVSICNLPMSKLTLVWLHFLQYLMICICVFLFAFENLSWTVCRISCLGRSVVCTHFADGPIRLATTEGWIYNYISDFSFLDCSSQFLIHCISDSPFHFELSYY